MRIDKVKGLLRTSTRPPPPHWTPLSREKDIQGYTPPPISGIVYKKRPLLKNPTLSRENGNAHAAPLCVRVEARAHLFIFCRKPHPIRCSSHEEIGFLFVRYKSLRIKFGQKWTRNSALLLKCLWRCVYKTWIEGICDIPNKIPISSWLLNHISLGFRRDVDN